MLIFQETNVPANDPRFGWNGQQSGQPASSQAYVYLIRIEFNSGLEQLYKGTVLLIR